MNEKRPQMEAIQDLLLKYSTVTNLLEAVQAYADWNSAKHPAVSHIWMSINGIRLLLENLDKEAADFLE